MNARSMSKCLLACAALAAGVWVPPAEAARSTNPCGYVSFEPDPNTPNDNGGYVHAAGMSCRAARREVRDWVLTDRDAEDRGWSCRRSRSTPPNRPAVNRTRCTKGRRIIKVTVHEL